MLNTLQHDRSKNPGPGLVQGLEIEDNRTCFSAKYSHNESQSFAESLTQVAGSGKIK